MRDINRQSGTTFVFSTHDRKVMNMADRLVRIADGQIIALGMKADDRWWFVDGRTPRDEDIREIRERGNATVEEALPGLTVLAPVLGAFAGDCGGAAAAPKPVSVEPKKGSPLPKSRRRIADVGRLTPNSTRCSTSERRRPEGRRTARAWNGYTELGAAHIPGSGALVACARGELGSRWQLSTAGDGS